MSNRQRVFVGLSKVRTPAWSLRSASACSAREAAPTPARGPREDRRAGRRQLDSRSGRTTSKEFPIRCRAFFFRPRPDLSTHSFEQPFVCADHQPAAASRFEQVISCAPPRCARIAAPSEQLHSPRRRSASEERTRNGAHTVSMVCTANGDPPVEDRRVQAIRRARSGCSGVRCSPRPRSCANGIAGENRPPASQICSLPRAEPVIAADLARALRRLQSIWAASRTLGALAPRKSFSFNPPSLCVDR